MKGVDDDGQVIVIDFGSRNFCRHNRLTVDETIEAVYCQDCKEKLTMWAAIKRLVNFKNYYARKQAHAELLMEEAQKKTKTKCEHCNRFTRTNLHIGEMKIVERAQQIEMEDLNGNSKG